MDCRMIEIDFDVHKKIETERRGFDESANDVLRRLLSIEEAPRIEGLPTKRKSWGKGVVELPHGTKLQATYNGHSMKAEIVDGQWVNEDGSVHTAPSSALSSFARTKDGNSTQLNGKEYWFVKLPGSDSWVLYKEFEAQRK